MTVCLCLSFPLHYLLPLPLTFLLCSCRPRTPLGLLLSCPLDSCDLIPAMGFNCTSHSLKFQPPPPLWNFLYLAPCTYPLRGQLPSESTGPLPLFHMWPLPLSSPLNGVISSQPLSQALRSSLNSPHHWCPITLWQHQHNPCKCSYNKNTLRPSSSLLEKALLHSLPPTTCPFFHLNSWKKSSSMFLAETQL